MVLCTSGVAGALYFSLMHDSGVKDAAVVATAEGSSKVRKEQTSKEHSSKKLAGAMKKLESRSRALAKKRTNELTDGASPLQSVGAYTRDQLENARDSVNEMIAASGTIYTQKIREEVMDELLEQPNAVNLLKQTLNDVDFARRAFGEDQGKMRHFAVETLAYLAKSGDSKPLRDTLSNVSNKLTQKGTSSEPGEVEDMTELVIAFAKNTPSQDVTMETISQLGYSDDMPPEISKAWKSSLFIGVWKKSGDLNGSKKIVSDLFAQG